MPEEAENVLEDFVDDSPAEDIEKAKAIGWKAPSEWKGNPPKGKFLRAKEYLERAETVIPIIKSENKKLKDEVAEARAELKAFKEETKLTVANMAKMSKVALDRQRSQLEEKYDSAIDAATEVGDKEGVKKLRAAEREDLKKFDDAADQAGHTVNAVAEAKESVNSALPKDVQDTIGGWMAENNWYSTDPEMQALANAHHDKLLKEKKGLTLAENLEETRKYVAKRFPEHFKVDDDEADDEPTPRGSRVEGGSRMAGGGSGTKFSKLPSDAKTQCDKFIKEDGLFLEKGESVEKDLAKARERYAAQYLES